MDRLADYRSLKASQDQEDNERTAGWMEGDPDMPSTCRHAGPRMEGGAGADDTWTQALTSVFKAWRGMEGFRHTEWHIFDRRTFPSLITL